MKPLPVKEGIRMKSDTTPPNREQLKDNHSLSYCPLNKKRSKCIYLFTYFVLVWFVSEDILLSEFKFFLLFNSVLILAISFLKFFLRAGSIFFIPYFPVCIIIMVKSAILLFNSFLSNFLYSLVFILLCKHI